MAARKRLLIFLFLFLGVQALYCQETGIAVYYTELKMPAAVQPNYYSLFDTKLLAEDLAQLLHAATGKTFSTMPAKAAASKGIILLIDSTLRLEGYETGIVKNNGKDQIIISAKYVTGLSYAMYSWLESLGFRFYLPGDEWMTIPSLRSVFREKINGRIYKPAFKMRMFNASGGIFPVKGLDEASQNEKSWKLWYRRNRMGCDYLSIDGHIGELFNITHKKEIEADSMILAPVNGKRKYFEEGKLDPTNPKAVSLFSNWIVQEYKNYQANLPSFLPFKKYYTVDPGDGLNYCHTPECERKFKSVSDQVFSIANETADKIIAFNPAAGVSLMAYTERADTPSNSIRSNVHVMVVPTAFQSVTTASELMQRWAKKTKNISRYDFLNIGVWAYDMPFFNLDQYYYQLQFMRSLRIEGMSFETSLSKFSSGIQQYFILKFLCEPYTSTEEILDEFCRNNFQQAATPIKKLLKEWYFNNTHLNTGSDKGNFSADELGRFIKYIVDAENTNGLTSKTKTRILELKAYLIYLCKFHELFGDLKNTEAYSKNNSLRSDKAEALLTYSWQMYRYGIFHNTQLNDMLKQLVTESKRASWDFRKSDRYKNFNVDPVPIINREFENIKKQYLPLGSVHFELTDEFLQSTSKYSADSIRISTVDEKAFGNYSYALNFYCSKPGMLKIVYQAGASLIKQQAADKIAIVSVESIDYSFIKNNFIKSENSNGMIVYHLPSKGRYRLYLSQYNATHLNYIIYPRGNLFFHDKYSLLMNGLMLQDSSKYYPNNQLAFIAPKTDSIYFRNAYYNVTNTVSLFNSAGKNIPVNNSRQPFVNAAANPKSSPGFVFFSNSIFRWPLVLVNSPPVYFFLRFPLK